jgi:hypothetical protein
LVVRSPQLPFPLQIDQVLMHGPVYLGQLRYGRSPLIVLATRATVQATIGNKVEPLATGSGELSPFMTVSSNWNLVDGLLKLSNMPAWIQLRYQVLSGDAEVQAHIPSLEYKQGRDAFKLEDLRVLAEGLIRPSQMATGALRFSLQAFSSPKGNAPLELQDLRLMLETQAVSNSLSLNMDVSLSAGEFDTQYYGPIRAVMEVNKLPEDELMALLTGQAKWLPLLTTNLSQNRRQQLFNQQLLPLLAPVLSSSEINLRELLMRTSDGWVEGKLVADFDSQQPMTTLLDMGMAMNMNGEFKMSRSWLLAIMETQLRQQLDSQNPGRRGPLAKDDRDEEAWLQAGRLLENLVKKRYLQASNGVYSSQIRVNDARLFMNDNEVDLFSMIQ